MPQSDSISETFSQVGADVKALILKGKYATPIYILEANQTVNDVPVDFPVGGLIFQKTA